MNRNRLSFTLLAAMAVMLGLLAFPAGAAELEYADQWGGYGTGDGLFDQPHDVAVGPDGCVYVADHLNHRIQKFTRDGDFLLKWGSYGTGEMEFSQPQQVAVDDSNHVFVTDAGSDWVRKFDSDGTFLLRWLVYSRPVGVTVDEDGYIYVAPRRGPSAVNKYTSMGVPVAAGIGSGLLWNARGVAVDSEGNICVADADLNEIFKFSADGTYLMQWGGGLSCPVGVAFDAADNLYVASGYNSSVHEFSSNGTPITVWNDAGGGPGQLNAPFGVFVDSRRSLFIADMGNHRIQRFDPISRIKSIEDVGNDQGRSVRINFSSGALDVVGSPTPIVRYDVFRRIDPLPMGRVQAPVKTADPNEPLIAGWDFAGSVPAYCEDEYNAVVPTLADSNAAGEYWTTFFVRAATAAPGVFYDTAPDSGYSVDNLSPAPPAGFVLARIGDTNHLMWDESEAADFDYYTLHRGSSADFVPDGSNLVAMQSGTGYDDDGPLDSYYKLAAVDFNGNASQYALASPDLTGVPEEPGSLSLFLQVIYPVGDQVAVQFSLPGNGPVTLALYNVAGRLVASRDFGPLAAGQYTTDMVLGPQNASAVYFLHLTQAGSTAEAKVVVVK